MRCHDTYCTRVEYESGRCHSGFDTIHPNILVFTRSIPTSFRNKLSFAGRLTKIEGSQNNWNYQAITQQRQTIMMIKWTPFLLVALSGAVTDIPEQVTDIYEACKDQKRGILNCVLENADVPVYDLCSDKETIQEKATCVAENLDPQCVGQQEFFEVQTCLKPYVDGDLPAPETLQDLIRNTGCFDDIHDCIVARVNAYMSELPDCVQSTFSAFGACMVENKETCLDTCQGTSFPTFDFDPIQLLTCNGIQNEIMDPVCGSISCCEPCVDEFEAVSNCIVNDVLDYTVRDCALTCAADDTAARQLLFRELARFSPEQKERRRRRREQRRRRKARKTFRGKMEMCLMAAALEPQQGTVSGEPVKSAATAFKCLTNVINDFL